MCNHSHLVMLVEDHSDLREATASLLEESHFRVLQAANGQQALDQLQRIGERPEAILLDLMMPVMDGWQFLEELQRRPSFANIPVVVISAVEDNLPVSPNITARLKKPASCEHLVSSMLSACCDG